MLRSNFLRYLSDNRLHSDCSSEILIKYAIGSQSVSDMPLIQSNVSQIAYIPNAVDFGAEHDNLPANT